MQMIMIIIEKDRNTNCIIYTGLQLEKPVKVSVTMQAKGEKSQLNQQYFFFDNVYKENSGSNSK